MDAGGNTGESMLECMGGMGTSTEMACTRMPV
jgi:hypothetical protein